MNYLGVTPASFVGNVTYQGDYTGTTAANYVGLTPVSYAGSLTYIGDYLGVTPSNYVSTLVYAADFAGTQPTAYAGSLTYLGDYLGVAGGVFSGPFPSTYVTSYDGALYTTTYTSIVANTLTYTGLTPSNYAGAIDYASTYGGSIINNDSSTIATRTLWRRIA